MEKEMSKQRVKEVYIIKYTGNRKVIDFVAGMVEGV